MTNTIKNLLTDGYPPPEQIVKIIGKDHMGRYKEDTGILMTADGYKVQEQWLVTHWANLEK